VCASVLNSQFYIRKSSFHNIQQQTTTLIHSNTTQDYLNSVGVNKLNSNNKHATCFGPYLGHPQVRQYKNHIKEDAIKI